MDRLDHVLYSLSKLTRQDLMRDAVETIVEALIRECAGAKKADRKANLKGFIARHRDSLESLGLDLD